MRRFLGISQLLGIILLLLAGALLIPIGWSLAVADGALDSLLLAFAGTVAAGLVLWLPVRRAKADLNARDGCLLVVLASIVLACWSAVPFLLHLDGLSFSAACFETLSALTTTGATRLPNLESLPQSLNLWRHLLQWLGGLGIIVLGVAILPLLGVGGMQLFRADTPGPMKESRLAPRVTQTGRYLWSVYAVLTVLCLLSLKLSGMDWFDALCHALSTVSLGGFSTRDANIAAFDSPAIEMVLMVFMMLSAINFTTHFLVFRQGSLQAYGRDTEARWVLFAVILSILLLMAVQLIRSNGELPGETLRHVAFATVSNATTGGFQSVSESSWPSFAGLWLLLLSSVVASSGSTGGGIKMVRTLILVKQTLRELLRMSHPRAVRPLMLGVHAIAPPVVLAVLGFMLLYGVTLIGLTLLLVASGMDTGAAFGGMLACLNNNGPGLAPFGLAPDYHQLTELQTWTFSFAMLAGRLELLIVFVMATPSFWRR